MGYTVGINLESSEIIFIHVKLTSESCGLALTSSDTSLEGLLQVMGMLVAVQIYSMVISPGPF